MAGKRHTDEEIKDAFSLYLKYGGERHDLIEADMQRLGWAGFRKALLTNRGKGENFREGWIAKYRWENSLKLHLASLTSVAATSAESLLAENEAIRKSAYIEIQTQGVRASKDLIYQHNTYTQNCIKILDKLEAARDNYANFTFFLNHLLGAAVEISPSLARELCEAEEALIDWAERKFVVEEETDAVV